MSKGELTRGERRLEALAARAREDAAPVFDVSQAVLKRLRRAPEAVAAERPMMWMTAGALAAAAVVVVLSLPYLSIELDPLARFLEEAASSAI